MTRKKTFLIIALLIVISIVARLIYHAPNVAPVTALALFISAYFGIRYSLPAILFVMLASDSLIGFYSWPVMIAVYGCFLVSGLIGYFLQSQKTVGSILAATLGSSLLFFFVTNWAVWQFGTMYEHTWQGLWQCYFMAIPFFKNSLFGDVAYTSLFFGIYEYSLFARRKNLLKTA